MVAATPLYGKNPSKLCFTVPRYLVSVYRTIGPLVVVFLKKLLLLKLFRKLVFHILISFRKCLAGNTGVEGFDKGLTYSMHCIVPIEIRKAEGGRQGPD